MLVFFAGASLFATPPESQGPKVTVGSKAFTESGILGEMLALLARHEGAQVEHRSGLTGTQIAWRSLQSGAIDGSLLVRHRSRCSHFPAGSPAHLQRSLSHTRC